jgi:hypothetical protein
MGLRPGLLAISGLLLAPGPGCERTPPPWGSALAASSKKGSDLRRLSLPDGKVIRAFTLPGPAADIARGPGGQVYLAAGREVLLLPGSGDPLPLLEGQRRIDSVLPSADGTRLFILEHPPAAVPAAGASAGRETEEASDERAAPHRLRLWDLKGGRFEGELELDPLAYEIFEGPGLILATHLKGRRIEIARVGPAGFTAGSPEVIEIASPAAGALNRQALIRAAAVAPGGGFILLAESGVDGELDRSRLWTLEPAGGRLAFHPLAARGTFQERIAILSPGEDGTFRAVLNGCDRMVMVSGSPAAGFREGKSIALPGLFFDAHRLLPPAPGAAGSSAGPRELILLAGSDARREHGFLAAVDPFGERLAWVRELPAAVDLLEIE